MNQRTTAPARPGFLTVHPSFFLTAYLTGAGVGRGVASVAGWVAVVFVSVLVHECGHALAARAYGHSPWIVLHGMGGTTYWARIDQTRRGPYALISLAGPFAGFALGGLVMFSARILPWPSASPFWHTVYNDALWANFGWGLINLLPIVPLDGGHVLQSVLGALFGPRAARAAVYFSVVAAGLLAVGALAAGWYWSAMLAAYFASVNVRALRAPAPNANANADADARPNASANASANAPAPAPAVTVEQAREALARGDASTAERLAKDLIARAPDAHTRSYPATLLASAYLAQGRYRESRAIAETMIEPPGDDYLVGRLMLHGGELEEGTARMRAAFERAPHAATGYWLMEALIWQKRLDEVRALALSPAASALDRGPMFDACAALFFAGRFEDSLAVAESTFARWGAPTDAYNAACALAQLGRLDEGLSWLGRAVDAGWRDVGELDEDEDLAALRAQPGFAEVRARVAANAGASAPAPAA